MVYPFARHVSERGHGHPDGFPVQLELKTERFGLAFRLLLACAFVRPESEQNSSHPPACAAVKVERWIDCTVRGKARRSEAGGPRPGLSSSPASATTTIYARLCRKKDGAVSSNLRCSDASIRLQVAAQPERFFDRLDKTASMKPIRPEENGILLRCTRNRRGV